MTNLNILPAAAQQLVMNAVVDQLLGGLKDNPVVGNLGERLKNATKRLEEINSEVDRKQAEGNRAILEIQGDVNKVVDDLQVEARQIVSDLVIAAENIMTPTGLESALSALRGEG